MHSLHIFIARLEISAHICGVGSLHQPLDSRLSPAINPTLKPWPQPKDEVRTLQGLCRRLCLVETATSPIILESPLHKQHRQNFLSTKTPWLIVRRRATTDHPLFDRLGCLRKKRAKNPERLVWFEMHAIVGFSEILGGHSIPEPTTIAPLGSPFKRKKTPPIPSQTTPKSKPPHGPRPATKRHSHKLSKQKNTATLNPP